MTKRDWYYKLQAVSDEKPGTYTVSVWAVSKANSLEQAVPLADFQIGTATVEKPVVEQEKCSSCHRGAGSDKLYLHHIDKSSFAPQGNWSLDQAPVQVCKTCHNNAGYAAFNSPVDGKTKIVDPIVNRVHGVHMGEHLKNPLNTDHATGVFKAYTGVLFPANVKDCTKCHVDDRWKTKPSALACTPCHDNVDLTTGKGHEKGEGPATDRQCATCHKPDGDPETSISGSHKINQPMNAITVTMTPPANGKFYVAGEKPVVTIVVKDDAGNLIDHTNVTTTTFSTAGLFVSGNRANTVPVLTNTAKYGTSKLRASLSSTKAATGTPAGWTFAAGDTFKIAANGDPPVELVAPAGLQTPAQVRDWLKANLQNVTVTSSATAVTIRSNIQGPDSTIDIYNGKVTTIMGWKNAGRTYSGGITPGVTIEPYVNPGRASYPTNDLRKISDPLDYVDPAVTRNVGNITYQLNEVTGLPSGTYSVYVWFQPSATAANRLPNVSRVAIGFMNFQIGTETEEKKVATNCTQCHGDTIWHLDEGPQHPEPFDPDYCKSCHDYGRHQTGDGFAVQGGTSTNGWSGYGAVPLSRRIQGLHCGAYLEHPEQIYAGNPDIFKEVIFPQDIRNCTKCHDPEGSAAWKQEPSRLACMACHDSAAANTHAVLSTLNPTPVDPWSSARTETCVVCHGPNREFAVEKVHNVSDPYKRHRTSESRSRDPWTRAALGGVSWPGHAPQTAEAAPAHLLRPSRSRSPRPDGLSRVSTACVPIAWSPTHRRRHSDRPSTTPTCPNRGRDRPVPVVGAVPRQHHVNALACEHPSLPSNSCFPVIAGIASSAEIDSGG